MRPSLLLTLTLPAILVLAGCAAPKPNAAPTNSAPGSATVGPDTGGIEGVVMDDEQMPIGAVEVGLVELGKSLRTGEDGRFVFSELAPGPYLLVAQRIGYETLSRKVDVVAGVVTDVTMVLQPMTIIEPYSEGPFLFDGHIQAGGLLIDVLASDLSRTTGVSACAKCNLFFNTSAALSEIVFELKFTPTVTNPTGPNVLEYQLWSYNQDGSLKDNYATDSWVSGAKRSFNRDSPLPGSDGGAMPAKSDQFLWFSYCEAFFVCSDQKFTIYYTFFYNGRAPEDFTALPTE